MFSKLLRPRAVLDEETTLWPFDTFAWALRNLEASVFYDESILVTPSNEHFPGTETSAHGMANLIFNQVKEHAGRKHWPTRLINMTEGRPGEQPRIEIQGALRGAKGIMGFGLMMANSAHTAKIRSCGSCAGPAVERSNALSQYEITYALAIFCCLKETPTRDVLVHLKKSLRPFYKRAAKEVMNNTEELNRVRANSSPTLEHAQATS